MECNIRLDLEPMICYNCIIMFQHIKKSRISYYVDVCYPPTAPFGVIATRNLKSESHLPKKCVISLIESLLKLMKNAFYFILKALYVLKIFLFFSRLFGHVAKTTWLERLTLKFMTAQPGLQTIAIHILPNISRSKGNQTMKFVQLIEYDKRNIIL